MDDKRGFNLVQNGYARSLQITFTVPMSILGLLHTAETLEDGHVSYRVRERSSKSDNYVPASRQKFIPFIWM
jgi:hypothetical protein